MSVVEHIVELRKRVIYTVLSFVLFLIIGFTFTKDIYFWLVKDLPMKLTVLGPSDVLWIFSRLLQYLLSFVQFLCCYTNLVICKTGFTSK